MEEIKITEDMIKNVWVCDDEHGWEIDVEYNGKMYNLYLWTNYGDEPSRDDWEKELEKELKREIENGRN